MASERTRRIVRLAKLAATFCDDDVDLEDRQSDTDPYGSSDSVEDPPYLPSNQQSNTGQNESAEDFSDNDNTQRHASTSENIENSAEVANIGSNLREPSSSSESEDSVDLNAVAEPEWKNPVGNHIDFPDDYVKKGGINPELAAALVDCSPFEFFSVFLDKDVINLMVEQTNLYATQVICSGEDIPKSSRLHQWTPTTHEEMLKFLGLVGYMGLVKMPTIRHYWSRKRLFRCNGVVSNTMSRNRFELLLLLWHFSDNDLCPPGDRAYKIQQLLDLLINKFQNAFTPAGSFCIDESLIPFRGRLVFKQYIPLKTHKYGVKLFKLCSGEGYTWNLKLYCGKEQDASASVPTKIVMTLSEKLLDQGRTAITDNWYTSIDLANKLLDRNTHLLGTLRSNRRGNPKDVIQKKLKRGDIIAKENARGITIMKWKDKRDVLLLSTKHTDQMLDIHVRGETKRKPQAVLDYNKGKSSIDLSDQMASYNSALRKSIKWYRKVVIEVLFGTSMVNAHYLYKKINETNTTITEFRESVYEKMIFPELQDNMELNEEKENHVPKKQLRKREHHLEKKEGPSHKTRKYCKGCYQKKANGEIHKNNVKKVSTYCTDCYDQPHYCLECFNVLHK
ncbi:piggyBac transposable element-derived protein 4-like [Anoplophora glabripennis]|uniref:piggyBac transposable element-derived protein 4-like n=1 Tax=Anoplophora glabripennis TaxID=217634 RepID=UPI00087458A8|nr:piggyBac transposable element-derived protein 4-like [Anoplophora glabripennis]